MGIRKPIKTQIPDKSHASADTVKIHSSNALHQLADNRVSTNSPSSRIPKNNGPNIIKTNNQEISDSSSRLSSTPMQLFRASDIEEEKNRKFQAEMQSRQKAVDLSARAEKADGAGGARVKAQTSADLVEEAKRRQEAKGDPNAKLRKIDSRYLSQGMGLAPKPKAAERDAKEFERSRMVGAQDEKKQATASDAAKQARAELEAALNGY